MKTKRNDRDTIRSVPNTFMSTDKEKKEIQKMADKMGVTMSTLCRMALKDLLKKSSD